MEVALRRLLEESFGEYIKGGLTVNASRFPLTLRDLQLNEKRIQEAVEEEGGGSPFELTGGKIGSISVNPGWMGVEICATDIVLNFGFSAVKAMQWAMKAVEADEDGVDQESDSDAKQAVPVTPPAPVAPRYCCAHASSEQRVKTEPRFEECKSCGLRLQTNYADFSHCPPCSNSLQRCMLCSAHAPIAGSYVPPQDLRPLPEARLLPLAPPRHLPAQQPAPRFCPAHDASEKRNKAEPRQRECTDCHMRMQTNYTEFTLCPACSAGKERCMICGACVLSPHSRTASASAFEAPHGESVGGRPTSGCGGRPASTASLGGRPASAVSAATAGDWIPDRRHLDSGGGRRGQSQVDEVARERCAVRVPTYEDVNEDGDGHRRPLASGSWREGSRRPPEPAGCGLQCNSVGPGSEGLDSVMGFLKMFDVAGVLEHCSASPGGGHCSTSPGGGHCSASPGGRDGPAPAPTSTCIARPPPPPPSRPFCVSASGSTVADPRRKLDPWREAGA